MEYYDTFFVLPFRQTQTFYLGLSEETQPPNPAHSQHMPPVSSNIL